MAYRKTKRSKETLARMQAGKDAARLERPAPDYPAVLPNLRRRVGWSKILAGLRKSMPRVGAA